MPARKRTPRTAKAPTSGTPVRDAALDSEVAFNESQARKSDESLGRFVDPNETASTEPATVTLDRNRDPR